MRPESNDLVADAISLLARLSSEELDLLRETMPFRPIVQAVEDLANLAPPHLVDCLAGTRV